MKVRSKTRKLSRNADEFLAFLNRRRKPKVLCTIRKLKKTLSESNRNWRGDRAVLKHIEDVFSRPKSVLRLDSHEGISEQPPLLIDTATLEFFEMRTRGVHMLNRLSLIGVPHLQVDAKAYAWARGKLSDRVVTARGQIA
jgi:hypothetical protein